MNDFNTSIFLFTNITTLTLNDNINNNTKFNCIATIWIAQQEVYVSIKKDRVKHGH